MVEIQQVFAEATFCASFAEARHQDLFVEWILDPQRYASAIIPQGRELISSTRSLPDDCLEAASDGTHLLECAVEMAGVSSSPSYVNTNSASTRRRMPSRIAPVGRTPSSIIVPHVAFGAEVPIRRCSTGFREVFGGARRGLPACIDPASRRMLRGPTRVSPSGHKRIRYDNCPRCD